MTVDEAFRLLQNPDEQMAHYEPLVPNAETVKAMDAAQRGEVKSFHSLDELMADLHAPSREDRY